MARDDLEQQLAAFGRTLEHRTGEPIHSAGTPDAPPAPPTGRSWWWLVPAAAACAALVVGAVVGLGRGDTAIAPATLPAVDTVAPPTTPVPGSTTPIPESTVTTAPDSGIVVRPWEPMIFSGTGSQTVEVGDDPVIARLQGAMQLRHDGSGVFRVTTVEENVEAERFETPILDTVGPYEGRRGFRLVEDRSGERRALRAIEVVADGEWSIELFSVVQSDEYTRLELVPGASVAGSGDDVIAPLLPPDGRPGRLVADVECADCAGDIEVVAIWNQPIVMVQATADGQPFAETVDLPDPAIVYLVQTSSPGVPGEWTITLRARDDDSTTTGP